MSSPTPKTKRSEVISDTSGLDLACHITIQQLIASFASIKEALRRQVLNCILTGVSQATVYSVPLAEYIDNHLTTEDLDACTYYNMGQMDNFMMCPDESIQVARIAVPKMLEILAINIQPRHKIISS